MEEETTPQFAQNISLICLDFFKKNEHINASARRTVARLYTSKKKAKRRRVKNKICFYHYNSIFTFGHEKTQGFSSDLCWSMTLKNSQNSLLARKMGQRMARRPWQHKTTISSDGHSIPTGSGFATTPQKSQRMARQP
jgi:hypothetical protein